MSAFTKKNGLKIKSILFVLLFMVLFAPFLAMGAEPKKKVSDPKPSDKQWSAPIRFFQKTLSRADGNRCPMYPTCSHYALEAFSKHNFFSAWVLTSDRLLRCGHDETRLSKRVRVGGRVKSYDPLTANTFWWKKP